jgi:cellulose synthase/poly-beta-1,6-N-acetylglucosamine synthase-like glycosyltransferase
VISAGHIFAFFSGALAIAWLWKGYEALRGMPDLPDLKRMEFEAEPPSPGNGPDLSIVVPARDEDASIESCLRSMLASTGVRLQIIAVDDRSGDETGPLMDAIAADAAAGKSPHQIEVMHIAELPPGWLGKPHALALGASRAAAPWILFTDGDVIFAPKALEIALRGADAVGADHLVLVPTLILKSIAERAVLAAMQIMSLWTVRLWKVADPRARDFIGAGGFNMIRSRTYREIGGFEALRMEVLEDLYLGKGVKTAGYAQRIVLGPDLVRVRWIDGPFAVIHLVEKNGFAITRFRTGLHLLACVGFAIHAFVPLIAIACGGWTMIAGLATYVGIVLAYHANRRASTIPAWYTVTFAPATLLVAYSFFRSMVLALARRGVVWRGTLYPLSELRRAAKES